MYEKPYNENKYERNDYENRFDDNPNNIKIGHKSIGVYSTYAIGQLLNDNKEVFLLGRGLLALKTIAVASHIKNTMRNIKFKTEIDSILIENNFVPTIQIQLLRENETEA